MNHLQEAKDWLCIHDAQDSQGENVVAAQSAIAHALIALVERLDALTDVEPTKDISCLRVYAPWRDV